MGVARGSAWQASRARRAQGTARAPASGRAAAAVRRGDRARQRRRRRLISFRDDIAQWSRSVVARAPSGAGKPPSGQRDARQRIAAAEAARARDQSRRPWQNNRRARPRRQRRAPAAGRRRLSRRTCNPAAAAQLRPTAPVAHTESRFAPPAAISRGERVRDKAGARSASAAEFAAATRSPTLRRRWPTLLRQACRRGRRNRMSTPAATIGAPYHAGCQPFEDPQGQGAAAFCERAARRHDLQRSRPGERQDRRRAGPCRQRHNPDYRHRQPQQQDGADVGDYRRCRSGEAQGRRDDDRARSRPPPNRRRPRRTWKPRLLLMAPQLMASR